MNGLTSSDIAHAPSFQDIAGDLAEQISGACVVGFGIANTLRIMTTDMYTAGIRSDLWEHQLHVQAVYHPHLAASYTEDTIIGINCGSLKCMKLK